VRLMTGPVSRFLELREFSRVLPWLVYIDAGPGRDKSNKKDRNETGVPACVTLTTSVSFLLCFFVITEEARVTFLTPFPFFFHTPNSRKSSAGQKPPPWEM
jgi:hypothetical protein